MACEAGRGQAIIPVPQTGFPYHDRLLVPKSSQGLDRMPRYYYSNAYSWWETPLEGILAGLSFFILFREVVIDETTTFSVLCSRYVGRSTGSARPMPRRGKGTGWRPEPYPPAQHAPGRPCIHCRH